MEAFTRDGLVTDVLDEAPKTQLKVSFDGTALNPGDVHTPTQVKDQPVVTWDADPAAYYTLIMNDPDAPSRKDPKFGEFHHWLVTNIPGCDVAKGDVRTGFVGSGAPKGTGLHRYVILLYKQPSKQDFEGLTQISDHTAEGRRSWKCREFATKYHLGAPVAGNFFNAEYDDHVPNVHRQMGLGK